MDQTRRGHNRGQRGGAEPYDPVHTANSEMPHRQCTSPPFPGREQMDVFHSQYGTLSPISPMRGSNHGWLPPLRSSFRGIPIPQPPPIGGSFSDGMWESGMGSSRAAPLSGPPASLFPSADEVNSTAQPNYRNNLGPAFAPQGLASTTGFAANAARNSSLLDITSSGLPGTAETSPMPSLMGSYPRQDTASGYPYSGRSVHGFSAFVPPARGPQGSRLNSTVYNPYNSVNAHAQSYLFAHHYRRQIRPNASRRNMSTSERQGRSTHGPPPLPAVFPRQALQRVYQVYRGSLKMQMVASASAKRSLISVKVEELPENDRCCMICYNNYDEESPEGLVESALRIPKCGHVFGDHCLKKWLGESDYCPYCRGKLPSEARLKGPSIREYLNNMSDFEFNRIAGGAGTSRDEVIEALDRRTGHSSLSDFLDGQLEEDLDDDLDDDDEPIRPQAQRRPPPSDPIDTRPRARLRLHSPDRRPQRELPDDVQVPPAPPHQQRTPTAPRVLGGSILMSRTPEERWRPGHTNDGTNPSTRPMVMNQASLGAMYSARGFQDSNMFLAGYPRLDTNTSTSTDRPLSPPIPNPLRAASPNIWRYFDSPLSESDLPAGNPSGATIDARSVDQRGD